MGTRRRMRYVVISDHFFVSTSILLHLSSISNPKLGLLMLDDFHSSLSHCLHVVKSTYLPVQMPPNATPPHETLIQTPWPYSRVPQDLFKYAVDTNSESQWDSIKLLPAQSHNENNPQAEKILSGCMSWILMQTSSMVHPSLLPPVHWVRMTGPPSFLLPHVFC